MSLPWDDPNADPAEDIRRMVADAQPSPPGQPVLVPRRLKEMLAGQVPDDHLVAYPEPATGYHIAPVPGEAELADVTDVDPLRLPFELHPCASGQCTYLVPTSSRYCCGPCGDASGGSVPPDPQQAM